jgi:hypothetical protein
MSCEFYAREMEKAPSGPGLLFDHRGERATLAGMTGFVMFFQQTNGVTLSSASGLPLLGR